MSDEIIALSEALERVQEDRELLLELFDIFQEDFVEKRENINKAVGAKDFGALRDIAHSMKGASSNISAKKIYGSLAKLEQVAIAGNDQEVNPILKNIDIQYQELKAQIEKLKKELKKQ